MNPTVRQTRSEPRPEAESSLLTRAVEAYRDLEQAGHKPDRAAFVACYPEIAGALSDCLAGLEWVEAFAAVRVVSDMEEAPAETTAALVSSLSDFRILREVGRGGMGIVYEAEQLSLGRRVALKILPMAAALDARRLQRFRNEAHAAAQLQHPHIVPVFAIGQEHGIHYYAMQFIDGSTLSQIIKRFQADTATTAGDARPVAESAEGESATIPFLPGPAKLLDSPVGSPAFFNAAAELGFQAAEALEHAHQLGIVHRDIKPANLMLDEEGHLWVTDFGLARHLGEADNLTKSGDLLGTIRYMSPEQAQARHGLVDQRTDIYALGITLYELVTRQAAFRADEREELLRQVCWEEPRAPRRIDHRVPADLETIILKAASKEPQSRYATAREMADDLKRFLHGEPIHARPTRTSERILNWCRRRPTLVRSAALMSVLMIVVLSVSMALIWRAEQKGEAKLDHASKRLALARQTFDEIGAYRDLWFMPMPNAQNIDDRFLAKAEAFYEQIAADDPAEAVPNRLKAASLQTVMAEQLASNGHPRQATIALNKASAILGALPADAQDEARCQYLRASCDHLRAKWQRSNGHYREAEKTLDRTFSVLNRLHTEDPNNREYRYGIAGCENERALILSATGRERAARDAFRHALHVLRDLKRENPEMPWIALPVAQISNNYANLLQAAAVRRARSAAARLAATTGAAASATGHASLGCAIFLAHDQATQNQDIRDALQLYADGIDLLQDLTGKFALHPMPRYELALAWNNLGRLRALTGQNEQARKAYLASVVHLEQLIIVFPKSKDYQTVLAGVQHNLAELSVPPQSPHSR